MNKYQKESLSGVINASLPKQLIDLSPEQVEKLKDIGAIILGVASIVGVATVAVVAPNALKLLKSVSWGKKYYRNSQGKNYQQKRALSKSFYYLKTKGYVNLSKKGSDWEIEITAKGRKKLQKISFQTLSVPKQKKWDGSWWIVLADIPTEDHKSHADQLRLKLKAMNFFPLQRTVWVHPFDPRDQVDFVSGYYKIDRFVTVIKATQLEEDDSKVLHKYFKEKRII